MRRIVPSTSEAAGANLGRRAWVGRRHGAAGAAVLAATGLLAGTPLALGIGPASAAPSVAVAGSQAAAPSRSAAPLPAPAAAASRGVPAPRGLDRATSDLVRRARPLPATVGSLTGTVVRVAVESDAAVALPGRRATAGRAGHREAATTTWLVSPQGRVQVPSHALAGVASGSRVTVTLGGPVTGSPVPSGPVTGGPGARTRRDATTLAEKGRAVRTLRVLETPAPNGSGARVTPGTPPGVAAAGATSDHTVTLVLVRPGGVAADATTVGQLQTLFSSTISPFWNEQTAGRVTFTVTTAVSWTTTSYTCTDDPFDLWADVADTVGFTDGPRNHLVLYLSSNAASCYAGLGTVGSTIDSGGYLYVSGTIAGLFAHELGHNMSLDHSNGLQCSLAVDGVFSGAWPSTCLRHGYWDWYDVMGISWEQLGSLSTLQAHRLGVLAGDQERTVSTPARADLVPVSGHTGLMSLRVADPAGATYVLEYRPAAGRDVWLASHPRSLQPGVLLRRVDPNPATATESLLLDGSPSLPTGFATDYNEPLVVGSTVTTASGRISIRVESVTGALATIAIAVDGVWPSTATPVAPTPPTRGVAAPGPVTTASPTRTPTRVSPSPSPRVVPRVTPAVPTRP